MARHRERFRDWLARCGAAAWWGGLWAWLALCAPALAEDLRAGLRIAEPADRSLLTRVRGQTGDLEVALQAQETAPLEASFAAQLEAARSLGREQGWRVVIWAVRRDGALELVVADFGLDRVLVRPLAGAASALELSAQEEAAALVARSALRASLAGSALGQPSEELAPAPEPAPEPPPPPERPPPPPPLPPPRAWGAGLEVGVLSGIDGASEPGHHAVFVRASLSWRRLELGVLGGYGVPVRVREALASLRLGTHRLEGSAGWALRRGDWQLVPSVAVGLHLLQLDARARDPRLRAEDARSAQLALGAFVRVAYQPGVVGVALRVGFDLLPGAPALGYEGERGFTQREQLWIVQPQLGLGFTL